MQTLTSLSEPGTETPFLDLDRERTYECETRGAGRENLAVISYASVGGELYDTHLLFLPDGGPEGIDFNLTGGRYYEWEADVVLLPYQDGVPSLQQVVVRYDRWGRRRTSLVLRNLTYYPEEGRLEFIERDLGIQSDDYSLRTPRFLPNAGGSPEQILYIREGRAEIVEITGDGGREVNTPEGLKTLVPSPDGSKFAAVLPLSGGRQGIEIFDLEGNRLARFLMPEGMRIIGLKSDRLARFPMPGLNAANNIIDWTPPTQNGVFPARETYPAGLIRFVASRDSGGEQIFAIDPARVQSEPIPLTPVGDYLDPGSLFFEGETTSTPTFPPPHKPIPPCPPKGPCIPPVSSQE